MSTKFPFTNAGVKDLLKELYELPDTELRAEADDLLNNFQAWIISHFELSEKQVEYLEGLHARESQFMASSLSFAVGNRLAVNLEKEIKEAVKGDPEYKVTKIKNNLTVTASQPVNLSRSDDQVFVAEGEVTVYIYYR